ncbi:MAG: NAD(P)/FAD-dependent oxidoreductase [Candidatus Bathyarchaeota archaeon]|nr:NAD(P)/FAD-dependent oxidoreductase [Candidatus Bathyarchaeota archaeon]
MDKVDAVVVGAGAVGLAIASEIAGKDRDIFILERESAIGQGASSRNSEVIHAGIYYATGTLKAKLCVEANPMLYKICVENKVPHKKLGKIIVGNGEDEVKQLEGLMRQGEANGVHDLELIDSDKIHRLEPRVRGDAAVLSPSTGIMDAHGLMDHYLRKARRQSGSDPLVLETEVTGITKSKDGYVVDTVSGGEPFSLEARVVVNAAGLFCDRVAQMVGIDIDEAHYRLHWCKGDYFSLGGKPPATMLVYPPPLRDTLGLGIHSVPDLTGRLKFGPNAYYVDKLDYHVESPVEPFWSDIVTYLPEIRKEDLHPDMAGIRAKLQGPGEKARDFVIAHEERRGYPGFIDLIGIESPGLTSSPAIAKMVAGMIEDYLD